MSGAERAVVIESIQQFQLGENALGRRLLERAHTLDAKFVQAGRFLKAQGSPWLHRHWVHAAFRRVRGWAGLEVRMRVLATAEVLAIPYYTALRDATGSRSICDRILAEETERVIAHAMHRCFLMAITLLVGMEHRLLFRAGRIFATATLEAKP